jgi:hypothetical protein
MTAGRQNEVAQYGLEIAARIDEAGGVPQGENLRFVVHA